MAREVRMRRCRSSLGLGAVWAAVLVAALAAAAVARLSPWPSALVIRALFVANGAATARRMTRYVPHVPLEARRGVAYGAGPLRTLDAYRPASATRPLPVVVWIHGGAWISGSTAHVDPYVRILAAHGYAAVALDYTIGPEGIYPAAVEDVAAGVAYVVEHAADLGVDPSRIVLAGDSAGAQLATQLAAMATDPAYADLVGIASPLHAGQLAGLVLDCGIYDLHAMADRRSGIGAWGFQAALWACTGTKDWGAGAAAVTMSTIDVVNAGLPPAWISGGNGDALTALQSVPMAERLRAAGVEVTALFWPDDHRPALGHEYQFHLERLEAQHALESTLDFLARVAPVDRA